MGGGGIPVRSETPTRSSWVDFSGTNSLVKLAAAKSRLTELREKQEGTDYQGDMNLPLSKQRHRKPASSIAVESLP